MEAVSMCHARLAPARSLTGHYGPCQVGWPLTTVLGHPLPLPFVISLPPNLTVTYDKRAVVGLSRYHTALDSQSRYLTSAWAVSGACSCVPTFQGRVPLCAFVVVPRWPSLKWAS